MAYDTETHNIAPDFVQPLMNGAYDTLSSENAAALEEWLAINDLDMNPRDCEHYGPAKCAITGLIADCEAVTWHTA